MSATQEQSITEGDILIPQAIDRPGHEPIQKFMADLGGDMDTWIGIDFVGEGFVHGLALGKQPFNAKFDPSWDPDQLAAEIKSGAWKVIKALDPEYKAEVLRRAQIMSDGLVDELTREKPAPGSPVTADPA